MNEKWNNIHMTILHRSKSHPRRIGSLEVVGPLIITLCLEPCALGFICVGKSAKTSGAHCHPMRIRKLAKFILLPLHPK
jgi:hypothetical protein